MANTVKFNDLKTIVAPKVTEVTLTNDGKNLIKLLVKNRIGFDDMLTFVNTVIETCVDRVTGEYNSALRAFATRFSIIAFYTNIEIGSDNEEFTDEQYEIVYGIGEDNYNSILSCINQQQLVDINIAINDSIHYAIQEMSSAATKEVFKFTSMIDKMVQNTGEMIENADMDTIQAMLLGAKGANEEEVLDKIVKIGTEKVDDK